MAAKPKRRSGPEPDRLKIEATDWTDALRKVVNTPRRKKAKRKR